MDERSKMPDWSSLSDWITPDRATSALVGAIITAAVALLNDQRRRVDESKSRFSEEKLRAYERMIAMFDVMGDFQLLRAETAPLAKKIENGEALNAADIEAQAAMLEQLKAMMETCDKYLRKDPRAKNSLITSGAAANAAIRLMKVIEKMEAYADADRYEKVGKLAMKYEIASAGLLLAAREDLGIHN
jgi:hypothetical protein